MHALILPPLFPPPPPPTHHHPQDNLAKKQAALLVAQEQLALVLAKVQKLKDKCVLGGAGRGGWGGLVVWQWQMLL